MNIIIKLYKIPLIFSFLLVIVHTTSWWFNIKLGQYGVFPLSSDGLLGIFTSPLIHSSWVHLFSNLSSLLLLFGILFYMFRSVAFLVFIISYILPGVFTWFVGRPSFHIGASGIVYTLIGFLLFVGVFTKRRNIMALSLFILFYHAGFFWGILPQENHISWETHLGGFVIGTLLAFFFKDFQFTAYNESSEITETEYSPLSATEDFEYKYFTKKKPNN